MMSHACGMGDEVPEEIVRLMLFLKVQGLSYGNSGVQVETVQLLIDFLNYGVYPVVYEQEIGRASCRERVWRYV